MRKKIDRQIKGYLADVYVMLPLDYPHRREVVYSIKCSLRIYRREHPNASYEDIIKEFGTSSEMVDSLLTNMTGTDMMRTFRKKSIRNKLMLGISLLMIALGIAVIADMVYWGNNEEMRLFKGPTYYYYEGQLYEEDEYRELQLDENMGVEE